MACAGERKNVLKQQLGEGSHSSCVHHEDPRHIGCLGCGLPRLQQPQETKRKGSYIL